MINPILYTSETNRIPKADSIKDTMIYTLCLGFLKEGQQVTLIAAEDYRPAQEEAYEFPVVFLKTVWRRVFLPRCFPYMPGLRGYLKRHGEYDYIISSEMFATWSYTAARVCGERTVIWHELAKHNHMMHEIPSRTWYGVVARLGMRHVTVVPRSRAAADFIGQFTGKVSDTVIDHGVNPDRFAPVKGNGKEKQFVVVSQLIRRKRIDRTMEAFYYFWRKGHQEYRLYIIGQGELEEELRMQARSLGLEDAVIFRGQLNHRELLPVVARSMALLVSTEKDNNMVSIAESIAAGTPVITTPVPYNADYIRKEKLGIVEDNWGMEALTKICEDNAFYSKRCMEYRERLSNAYCAAQFLKVLKEISGS